MKALPPTPRRTAIRTPASLLSCSQATDRPSYIRQVMALRACGRSNRIVATAPSRTKRTSPSFIGLLLHFFKVSSGCSSSQHRLEKLFVLLSGDSPLLAGSAIVLDATALAGFGRIPPRLPTSRQLLDCCLQRSGSIVIIIPHVAALDKRRPCSHSEAFSIQACLHLRPGDRHRNRRAQSGARRQRRDCRRLSVIAEIVEEDFARPLAL